MNINSVLCPVDFSESSEAALRYAALIARESGARLTIVHVEETLPEYPTDITGYSIGTAVSGEQQLIDLLSNFRPTLKGVDFEPRHLKGSPAREILRFADQEKIDLIVMGTHGRRGLLRLLMGSVAELVVRRAKCPVLTIRQPEIAPEEAQATKHRETA